jgi:hypothetical protein
MDNWKKYMAENEDKLSIEEVDDRVWQLVYQAGVTKKKSFIGVLTSKLWDGFRKAAINREVHARQDRYRTLPWALGFVIIAFVAVSCTYQVKSYARVGDMVSFALAKQQYWMNYQGAANSILHSFSRVSSPTDTSVFLFFRYIQKSNPEGSQLIAKLDNAGGVSNLVITPVVYEYKESLFSSLVHKAFDIQIKEVKPDSKQIKNTIKGILKVKGLNTVDVQIGQDQDIRFISKHEKYQQLLPVAKDSLNITNAIADSIKVTSKPDTSRPKQVLNDLRIDMPNVKMPGWKEELALTTDLMKALDKEGLVDNKKAYHLEIKDGEFFINNIKQPKEVTDKFRKYFRNDNYTINNDPDEPAPTSKDNDQPVNKQKGSLSHLNSNPLKFDGIQYQKDLKLMYLLIDGLHNDGLIDKKKPYTVQIKEGELYIDRKKQPKEVSDKFRKYFSGDNYGFVND